MITNYVSRKVWHSNGIKEAYIIAKDKQVFLRVTCFNLDDISCPRSRKDEPMEIKLGDVPEGLTREVGYRTSWGEPMSYELHQWVKSLWTQVKSLNY